MEFQPDPQRVKALRDLYYHALHVCQRYEAKPSVHLVPTSALGSYFFRLTVTWVNSGMLGEIEAFSSDYYIIAQVRPRNYKVVVLHVSLY